jgi:ArsR family transcriptional regulator
MAKENSISRLEALFGALADRTRLRLLNLMGGDEICVCFLVEALDLSQPKISRHLAYLRDAGLVSARREGKWMHYRITEPDDETAARILQETLRGLQQNEEMRQDRASLVNICCAPALPVQLARAPRPAPANA